MTLGVPFKTSFIFKAKTFAGPVLGLAGFLDLYAAVLRITIRKVEEKFSSSKPVTAHSGSVRSPRP
jgi:hypothetical protein